MEGDLLRRLSYRMQFVTPVGPPVTRVHRVQRWYAADKLSNVARLDSCSVTPDIMFGDQVVILERMYIEQLSSEPQWAAAVDWSDCQVRVRVYGGVRFKSRPWKMKPFIGLIQQRSREDVKAGVEQWEQFVKRRMQEEPDKVETCRKRVAALRRGKSAIEQLLARRPAGQAQRETSAAPPGSRSQSSQSILSHDAAAASLTLPARFLTSDSRSHSALQHPATSPCSSNTSAPAAGLLSPANRTQSFVSSSSTSHPVDGAAGGAVSRSPPLRYWLSIRPIVRRLLPSFLSQPLVERMDVASAAVSSLDGSQSAALLFFTLSFLAALLVGPGHRLFALCTLLFIAFLALSVFTRPTCNRRIVG